MASIFSWFKKRNSLNDVSDYRKTSRNKSQKQNCLRTNSSNKTTKQPTKLIMKRSTSMPNEPDFSRMSFQISGIQRNFDIHKTNRLNENNLYSHNNRNRNVYSSQVEQEIPETKFNSGKIQRQPQNSLDKNSFIAESSQVVLSRFTPHPMHRYSVSNSFFQHQGIDVVRRNSDTMQAYVPRALSQTNVTAALFGIKHEMASLSKEDLLLSRSVRSQFREPGRDSSSWESYRKFSDVTSYRHPAVTSRHSMYETRDVSRLLDNPRLSHHNIPLVQSNVDGNFFFTSSMLGDVIQKNGRQRHTERPDDDFKTLADRESNLDNVSQLSLEVGGQSSDGHIEVNNNRKMSWNDGKMLDLENNNRNVIDFNLNDDDVVSDDLGSDDVIDGGLSNGGVICGRSNMAYDFATSDFSKDDVLMNDEIIDEEVASILRHYDEIVDSACQ